VEDSIGGAERDPVVVAALDRSRLVDPVFAHVDLRWWS
jgi:hypothetical protein